MSVEIKNKKASYTYFLTDSFTAGMKLTGTEIKSIRGGKASITEAYCRFQGDEIFVFNMYIAEYPNGGYVNHEPYAVRKLLLNKHELSKIKRKMKNVGYTLVPTRVFISDKGWAKMEFSIAKGKKLHDKRATEKAKEWNRDKERLMKNSFN
ncbi:MAG: SsrA-binding protein SmpB [Flavobacteriales bacterium]|nr:SsrA-binding protein SmpB [Flavobacteriales bacterium]